MRFRLHNRQHLGCKGLASKNLQGENLNSTERPNPNCARPTRGAEYRNATAPALWRSLRYHAAEVRSVAPIRVMAESSRTGSSMTFRQRPSPWTRHELF